MLSTTINRMLRAKQLLVLLVVAGCGGGGEDTSKTAEAPSSAARSSPKPPLLVVAASDLQTALPVLAERFSKETGIEVSLTFGASGQLAEQIKAGAPFDVFLAANQSFVKALGDEGAVRPDSVRPYARGTLVLAVHAESEGAIATLADLAKPDVKKIALANPAFAPYGAAGKQALERAQLWDQVQPKIVQSESVRQALQFVETGNAEAGLVGKAIAQASKKVRVVAVDAALYDPITQALGIVARTKLPEEAQRFADFVLGAPGQKVLREFGFSGVGSNSKGSP